METMNPLKLEISRFRKFQGDGSLRGYADIAVEGKILIKGIRIVEGNKGIFVSMPREQGKDGKWYDQVQVLDEGLRSQLSQMVLAAYENGALQK